MSDINELYTLVKKEKAFDKFRIGIQPYKPILIEKNFRDGFVTRYFAKYIPASSISITEIDESTYKQIKKNPLYQTIEVRWKILGKLNDYVINKDCCGNAPITIVEQTGNIINLTPEQFNSRKNRIEDKIITDKYIIGFGIATENRKNVEYADLTMTGLLRYITNYTEFWQGE